MKQVSVIGLGQFGRYLATSLAGMGCDVLAIDNNEDAVSAIRDQVQQAIITDVRNQKALQSVISKEIDEVIVCFSENMEASILCVLHLHNIGVKYIRAKAANHDHEDILKAIGAHEVIFPEEETAKRIAQRVMNPDLLDYLPLSEEYRVVEINIPKGFVGHSLADLHLRQKYNIHVLAIKTPSQHKTEFLPSPQTDLKDGDTMLVIGKEEGITNLREAD
jgi:trk system potassium uptake protein TrkA